jgi:hypothetical protein
MDARRNIKTRLQSGHVTAGDAVRTVQPAALFALLDAHQCGVKFNSSEAGEIFKKTPCAAGLNRGGRDVAKDMIEIGEMPFPPFDRGHFDAVVAAFNVNLTDAALPGRQTKSTARDTHHRSGALWKYARQIGPTRDGAVIHPGSAQENAHEKQCYADV